MPASNQSEAIRPSGNGLLPYSRGDLRPDLAAFFVRAQRELAPRRMAAEHGVLGELYSRAGSD